MRGLRARWLEAAGAEAQDADRFHKWLVAGKVLTEYQIVVLGRGNVDQLFLPPYTLLDRVGKGRMAGVYKAAHGSGQVVAIKILPPSKAKDPPTLARFQREARLALRLKHPNIVRTFHTGENNGLHYLVMEYLDGETLDEVFQRRGPLPAHEAVRLVHQALLGLEQVHDQGLIHRDIKPENLILVGGRPDNTARGTLKILDIGTGRALFDEGQSTELTNDGDLLGTPEYMAPEQARDPRKADIRADIYSVGCVLYHALAGRPPFADANRVRLLIKHATEAPRPIREINPSVPEGLQQILDWMLTKDPAARYPTPARAAQGLQVFLAAGAEEGQAKTDASMDAYLHWLQSQDPDAGKEPPTAPAFPPPTLVFPAAPPTRPAPADPVPPRRPDPAPVAAVVAVTDSPTIDVTVPVPPRRPDPAPVAAVVAVTDSPTIDVEVVPETIAPRRRPPVPPPPPPPRPAERPKKKPAPVSGREEDDEPEEEGTVLGLSRRDLAMLAIGIGALAVAGSVGLAVWAMTGSSRRRKEPVEETPPEPQAPAPEQPN